MVSQVPIGVIRAHSHNRDGVLERVPLFLSDDET